MKGQKKAQREREDEGGEGRALNGPLVDQSELLEDGRLSTLSGSQEKHLKGNERWRAVSFEGAREEGARRGAEGRRGLKERVDVGFPSVRAYFYFLASIYTILLELEFNLFVAWEGGCGCGRRDMREGRKEGES